MELGQEQEEEEDEASFFENLLARLCIDEQRTISNQLNQLDEQTTKLHDELLTASREAHERVYRAAEAERKRALELEARERRARIERPPDPLPPSPPPPTLPPKLPASSQASDPGAFVGSPTPAQAQAHEKEKEEEKEKEREKEGSQTVPGHGEESLTYEGRKGKDSKAQDTSHTQPSTTSRVTPNGTADGLQSTLVGQTHPTQRPPDGVQGKDVQEIEGEHDRYVQIHQRLKSMRTKVIDFCKRDRALKSKIGDMRRDINLRIGQLTSDKVKNRQTISKVIGHLKEARQRREPQVNFSQFLLDPPHPQINDTGLFIYLLNMFCKQIVAQLAVEAGRDSKRAEPIGIMISSVFAEPALQLDQHSLIDVLLAKYHIACPILFGIRGDPKTRNGRRRLGWQRVDGEYIPENAHHERQVGLGAGYASFSLRNFSKSQKTNPYPCFHFWCSLARVLNTPHEQITITHVCVLRGLLENYMVRFVEFWGRPAYVALKKALIEFPTKAPRGPATSSLAVLRDVAKRDHHLSIQ